MNSNNPYVTFAGVYVPHFVLSSHRVSPAAKILYALLAAGADIRGESLLSPALLAAKMGVDEEAVLQLMDELGNARLIKVRQDPAGTEFLYWYFPPNAWRKDNLPCNEKSKDTALKATPRLLKLSSSTAEGLTSSVNQIIPDRETQSEKQVLDGADNKKNAASRFSKEVCIEYAKARREVEGKIDNPYALGTALWKSGDGDEEIQLWVWSKESDESAA
jgi:hypothetical protein